jgi:hypothetical protein
MDLYVTNPPWVNSPWVHPNRVKLQALIRFIKLWHLRYASSHASTKPYEIELYEVCVRKALLTNFKNFSGLSHEVGHRSIAVEQHPIDGQRRIASLFVSESQPIYTQEQPHISFENFVELIRFLAAYNIVSLGFYAIGVLLVLRILKLRDKIKALNLPKNLFPQSLRPIKAAAL